MKKLLLVLMAFGLVSSCAVKERVVTVERVRTDTLRETRNIRDSIYLHDSVWVKQYERGETVFVEKERWHTRYQDRLLMDTMYVSRMDSVPVPYPVEVKVEKELSTWQSFRMTLGTIALCMLAVYVVYRIIRKKLFPPAL